MNFSETGSPTLAYSQIRSLSGNELTNSRAFYQHSLPLIAQPLLTKYRTIKPGNQLVIQQTPSLWCTLFGSARKRGMSLCKCERTQQGQCELVTHWIEQLYDWRGDPKFTKAYRNYTRRNIEIFIGEGELRNRLDKKLQILGVRLAEKYKAMLLRICKNYLKHTVYYGRAEILSKQNDLWMWFAIGVFYHIGAVGEEEGIQEELIFWSVDIVMNHLGTITRTVIQNHVRRMLELIREYFEKWHQRLMQYQIDLEAITNEWMNELMMGYMGIDSIAFFIDCLLKRGWNYVYKLMLSYFQKRMEKMDADQLFLSTDREVVLRELMTCNQEWPLIFCNANTFCFDQPQSSTA